jgi:hypothetical protein
MDLSTFAELHKEYESRKSDINVTHFCKEKNIAKHIFYYWKNRLLKDPAEKKKTTGFLDITPREKQNGAAINIQVNQTSIAINANCPERLLKVILHELS